MILLVFSYKKFMAHTQTHCGHWGMASREGGGVITTLRGAFFPLEVIDCGKISHAWVKVLQ